MAQRQFSIYDGFTFPDYVYREYPKALKPPSFTAERKFRLHQAMPNQAPVNMEDYTEGPHAQVIVNNEEEEKAVLAMWKEKFDYTPPAPQATVRSTAELEAEIADLNSKLKAAQSARDAATDLAKKVAAETAAKAKAPEPKPAAA